MSRQVGVQSQRVRAKMRTLFALRSARAKPSERRGRIMQMLSFVAVVLLLFSTDVLSLTIAPVLGRHQLLQVHCRLTPPIPAHAPPLAPRMAVPGAAAWYGGHAAALGVYLVNWLAGARLMPRGVPQREFIDKEKNPRLLKAFLAGVVLELMVVYVLPWPAMALEGGRWLLGTQLFLPIMLMTVINIALEGYYRRQQLVTLTYANTGASGLWRLLSYCAVLSAIGGMRLPWFKAVALLGAALHIMFIVVFTCLITAGLPLKQEESDVLTSKDMGIPGLERGVS